MIQQDLTMAQAMMAQALDGISDVIGSLQAGPGNGGKPVESKIEDFVDGNKLTFAELAGYDPFTYFTLGEKAYGYFIPTASERQLMFFCVIGAGGSVELHEHPDCIEIISIMEGELRETTNARIKTANKQFKIDPNIAHRFYSDAGCSFFVEFLLVTEDE